LDPSKQPTTTPFYRTDVDSNQYEFIANTKPLFRNLPTHANLAARTMTLDDLKSSSTSYTEHLSVIHSQNFTESTTLPHPADMQYRTNSNLVEDIGEPHDVPLNIRSIPDPEDVYAMTLGAADVTNSYIYIPNIRNGDGNLITPDQYETNLEDGSIVMVNMSLKL
jgi:hypothetical protein